MPDHGTLVLLRHGESTLNAQGRFTGLLNPPLTARGRAQSLKAAAVLASAGFLPELIYSSTMVRATETGELLTAALTRGKVPVSKAWELNERSYGALTGRRRTELLEEFGLQMLHRWRRSLDEAPPPMSARLLTTIGRNSAVAAMPQGAAHATESLNAVATRIRGFWQGTLRPALEAGSDVLVVGHGNSLRALCLVIDSLGEDEVESLNLPTGHPLEYGFDPGFLPSPRGGTYLDPSAAAAAVDLLAAGGGT
ncbi:2,3-bisphosphoglycerate-dependent phosphoglycerate mutase [Paeniglutamicibacter antarcticus]|uniref:2,3-bisphosphoglycerate-dependent phosphoglycerate mutase n=1 Tax=Paeniglutamicibacter antarcticus TaxID=494023 RepID=A0ABP9THH1_9MICC